MSRCIKWFSKTNYYSVQVRGKKIVSAKRDPTVCLVSFMPMQKHSKIRVWDWLHVFRKIKTNAMYALHQVPYLLYLLTTHFAFASKLPNTRKLFHLQIHNSHAHLRVTPKFHGKKSKIIVSLIAFCISLCE